MKMDRPTPADRHERTLRRRSGRARRSRWLGRLVFSLTGMGLVLLLRVNPEIVADTVSYVSAADQNQRGVITRPSDVQVRTMPASAVPIRRGGSLQAQAPQGTGPDMQNPDLQNQADALSVQLANMRPGN